MRSNSSLFKYYSYLGVYGLVICLTVLGPKTLAANPVGKCLPQLEAIGLSHPQDTAEFIPSEVVSYFANHSDKSLWNKAKLFFKMKNKTIENKEVTIRFKTLMAYLNYSPKEIENFLTALFENTYPTFKANEITWNTLESIDRFFDHLIHPSAVETDLSGITIKIRDLVNILNRNQSREYLKYAVGGNTYDNTQMIDQYYTKAQADWARQNNLTLYHGGQFVSNIGSRLAFKFNAHSDSGGVFEYRSKDGRTLISYKSIQYIPLSELLIFFKDAKNSPLAKLLLFPIGVHFVYGKPRLLFEVAEGKQIFSNFNDLPQTAQNQLKEVLTANFYESIKTSGYMAFSRNDLESEYLFLGENGLLQMAFPVRGKLLVDSFYSHEIFK